MLSNEASSSEGRLTSVGNFLLMEVKETHYLSKGEEVYDHLTVRQVMFVVAATDRQTCRQTNRQKNSVPISRNEKKNIVQTVLNIFSSIYILNRSTHD